MTSRTAEPHPGRRRTSRLRALLAPLTGAVAARRTSPARPGSRSLEATERDLAETSERYRSLFTYYPQAVFSLDLEGRYLEVNPAGGRLSGVPTSELLGKNFTSLIAPEDLARTHAAFLRVLDREAQHLESTIVHRDGHLIELDITALPIVVADEVVGVYGVAEDITERNRVRRDLAHAVERAEQANEAKSIFLANMSHEIRTPLTSVIASAELLADADLGEQEAHLVTIMNRNGERLLRLVDQILDFSRIEAGKAELVVAAFDPAAVVAEVLEPHRAVAEARGLSLRCDLDPGLPPRLVGDAGRISQVLTNLVDNAIKFTERGTVTLSLAHVDPNGPGVEAVFVVADTGIGIRPDELDRLYEPFAQGDQSTTRKYGGTGLGLAICRRLVGLMGGEISVESQPGAGSTFSVRLPLGLPTS